MKKQILTLTTSLALTALVGCGKPKADQINVDSLIHGTKEVNQLQVNKEVDPAVRKGTIIIFPTGNELDGFSYEFPEKYWKPVIVDGRLPYGKQLPRIIQKDDTSANKTKNLVNILLSIGKLKDISFRLKTQAKMKDAVLKGQKKQVIASVGCYKIKEGDNAGKCKIAPDETTVTSVKRAKRSCTKLATHMDNFIDLTPEQDALFKGTLHKCKLIKEGQNEVKKLSRKINAATEAGEVLAEGVATAYSVHLGKNHLPLMASQDRQAPNGYDDSRIKFNADKTKIEELKLAINFGGGDDAAVPMYSIENGKILNAKLAITAKGTRYLEFTINGPIIVKAMLSITSEVISLSKDGTGPSFTNYRLKGTTDNIFPNGTVKKGVMSIEMDTLN